MSDIEFAVARAVGGAIDPDVYLDGLNTCFGHWGDMRQYRWCFERDAGAGTADLILATVADTVVGGSAVVYRTAVSPAGARVPISIMCGSWTLPAARGKGCFTGMIEHSLEIGRERGAALLLAFVTEHNPSRRRLEARGSTMIPTAYCVAGAEAETEAARGDGAGPATPSAPASASASDEDVTLADIARSRTHRFHFGYRDLDAWRAQHLTRQLPTRTVHLPSGGRALIEEAEDTDRVLALVASENRLDDLEDLRRYAATRGRKTFFFTSDADEIAGAGARGFRVIPGFLTALVSDRDGYRTWLGQAAGRDADAGPVRESLLPWRLEHGDRM